MHTCMHATTYNMMLIKTVYCCAHCCQIVWLPVHISTSSLQSSESGMNRTWNEAKVVDTLGNPLFLGTPWRELPNCVVSGRWRTAALRVCVEPYFLCCCSIWWRCACKRASGYANQIGIAENQLNRFAAVSIQLTEMSFLDTANYFKSFKILWYPKLDGWYGLKCLNMPASDTWLWPGAAGRQNEPTLHFLFWNNVSHRSHPKTISLHLSAGKDRSSRALIILDPTAIRLLEPSSPFHGRKLWSAAAGSPSRSSDHDIGWWAQLWWNLIRTN